MDELTQYKEKSEKYFAEEKKLEEYRNKCKDDAIDLLKEHFLFPAITSEDFINKRNILCKAYKMIERDIKEVNNG